MVAKSSKYVLRKIRKAIEIIKHPFYINCEADHPLSLVWNTVISSSIGSPPACHRSISSRHSWLIPCNCYISLVNCCIKSLLYRLFEEFHLRLGTFVIFVQFFEKISPRLVLLSYLCLLLRKVHLWFSLQVELPFYFLRWYFCLICTNFWENSASDLVDILAYCGGASVLFVLIVEKVLLLCLITSSVSLCSF